MSSLPTIRDATLLQLDAATLYDILALRSAVFVVEQNCAYLDPDGREREPLSRFLWVEADGQVVATLRLLGDADGSARIGRVATAASARGQGLAAQLMSRALELAGPVQIVLDAQSHLRDWYGRFGFQPDGLEYVEDGIPHIPMRRQSPS